MVGFLLIMALVFALPGVGLFYAGDSAMAFRSLLCGTVLVAAFAVVATLESHLKPIRKSLEVLAEDARRRDAEVPNGDGG